MGYFFQLKPQQLDAVRKAEKKPQPRPFLPPVFDHDGRRGKLRHGFG